MYDEAIVLQVIAYLFLAVLSAVGVLKAKDPKISYVFFASMAISFALVAAFIQGVILAKQIWLG